MNVASGNFTNSGLSMLQRSTAVNLQTPAQEYLQTISGEIAKIRSGLPSLIAMGERMAGLMLEGGELFNPAVNPFWPSEFGGRAGGFMGIHSRPTLHLSAKNVA